MFTTVFRTGEFGGVSFLLFVAVALWPWLAAQEALQRGDRQPRELRGADPQGRVSARARRLRVGRGDARAAVRGYLAVLVVLALFGEPVHFEGLLLAVPLWLDARDSP